MANIRSAEKRNRQSQKRRQRNVKVRTGIKGAIKKAREALSKTDKDVALQAVHEAIQTLGKAASKGVLHKNNVARRISRLQLAAAKMTRPAQA